MYMADNIIMAGETHARDPRLTYNPILQTYTAISITAMSSEAISLMKWRWLPMCQSLSGITNILPEVFYGLFGIQPSSWLRMGIIKSVV